jgi:hypothetical protein
MIRKVLPEAWEIDKRFDSDRLQLFGVSKSRMEKYMRRADTTR